MATSSLKLYGNEIGGKIPANFAANGPDGFPFRDF